MKAIKNTWKTLTDTLGVMGRSSSYRVYPLLSYIIMLLVTLTIMAPLLGRALGVAQEAMPARILFFLAVYVMYGVLYLVITFFDVALVHNIAGRLDGEHPRLAAGLVRASERIGLIAISTLVSATLGLLSFLARTLINPIFGMFIAPAIGNRLWEHWRRISYHVPLLMAVPIIALDRPVPENVFERGEQLAKATWGERVKPAHSVNLLALFVLLPIILLFAMPALRQGAAEHNAGLIRYGSSVLLVSILTYTQVSALANAIFALAAYCYATARKSDLFPGDASYAEQAFVKAKKAREQGDAPTGTTSDSRSAARDSST